MANLNAWQKISRVITTKDFGDGSAGNTTISSDPSTRASLTTVSSGGTAITIGSAILSNGDVFALYQARGTGVGQWEINKVSSGGGTTSITCSQALQYSYSTTGSNVAQVIKLPLYDSVTLNSFSVTAWDGSTGGITFIVGKSSISGSGTLSFNGSNGSSGGNNTAGATGGGYRGGQTSHANPSQSYAGEGTSGATVAQSTPNGSGGAGSNTSGPSGGSPGSGGGNGTAGSGGSGGSTAGSSDLTTMVFGGGGGGGSNDGSEAGSPTGAGASGGAILVLISKSVDLSGMTLINLNGGNGGNAVTQAGEQSAGGGGAGGSCLIVAQVATLGTNKVTASGGTGGINTTSSIQYGTNGGDGRITLHYSSSYTGSTTPTLTANQDTSLVDGQFNSVKASIVVKNITNNNSSKAKIASTRINSVKAYIPTHQETNQAKGFIVAKSIRKSYEYRIYDDNVYVTTWVREVISQPSFRTIINGGASELVIRLARPFDNFGEDLDVKLNNRVDLWCFDRDTVNGVRIYQGYISGYKPVIKGSDETVEVTVLNYLAETSGYLFRNSSGDTTITYSSVDPSTIMTGIIDRYRASGGTLNYTSTSIETTGTTVSYTFSGNSVKEALDKVVELCPAGWYWFVDSNGIVNLKPQPTTTTHKFRIGREISEAEIWRRGEDIVNEVFFTGGGSPQMFRYYKNDGSIASYGRRAYKMIDQRVTVTATADTMVSRLINSKKDPEIRTKITINDNSGSNHEKGYDIESINVGDTFRIGNLKEGTKTVTLWDVGQWDTDVWDTTLTYLASSDVQILSVDYSPDSLVIEASSRVPDVNKRIEDINRNAQTTVLINNPTTPTIA